MKYIIKIINWIKKETWWRPYYKRVTLDEKKIKHGRCLTCDAGIFSGCIPVCSFKGRDCPCKYNQCLIKRRK